MRAARSVPPAGAAYGGQCVALGVECCTIATVRRTQLSRMCFAAAAAVARDAARTANATVFETPVAWPEYRAAVRDRIAALAAADGAHWHGAEAAGVTSSVAARLVNTASNGPVLSERQVMCPSVRCPLRLCQPPGPCAKSPTRSRPLMTGPINCRPAFRTLLPRTLPKLPAVRISSLPEHKSTESSC